MAPKVLHERLPAIVQADYVDEVASRLWTGPAAALQLELASPVTTSVFADARLLGLLSLMQRRRMYLSVSLRERPSPGSPLRPVMQDSITGFLLTHYAAEMLSGRSRHVLDDVTRLQEQRLESRAGELGSATELTLPIADRAPRPVVSPIMLDDFITTFTQNLKLLLRERLDLRILPDPLMDHLCQFAFEAVQNTREHGSQKISGQLLEGVRFITLRKIDIANSPDEMFGAVSEPALRSYLDRLFAALRKKTGVRYVVELTVADGGVGIAAKMAGSFSVYEGPLDDERSLFERALTPQGTSKSASVAGAGQGLDKMLKAAAALSGMIAFRTGRLHCHASSLATIPRWSTDQRLLTAGTAVSLVFPWTASLQPVQLESLLA